MNNKDADHPVHMQGLINVFVVHCLHRGERRWTSGRVSESEARGQGSAVLCP